MSHDPTITALFDPRTSARVTPEPCADDTFRNFGRFLGRALVLLSMLVFFLTGYLAFAHYWDSNPVDDVRSHGAERRISRTLIGIHKQAWLRWQVFQVVFLPVHGFLSGGGGNSAVPTGFTRIPIQNRCPSLGRELAARPANCHSVQTLESE